VCHIRLLLSAIFVVAAVLFVRIVIDRDE